MVELIKRFSAPYRRELVFGPLFKFVEVIFDLMTPLVVARMIDEGVGPHDLDTVVRYCTLLVVMAFAGIACSLVCQKMAARASQGIGTCMRRDLYRHINTFSDAELAKFGTPSLVTRLTNDINQVQLAIAFAIRQLVRWPFLAVGSMLAAILIDVRLGLIFLVAMPLVGGLFWFVLARCVPYFQLMQAQLDRIALIVREGLSGVRVIRAFVREGHERERFHKASAAQAATAIAAGKLSALLNPGTILVMNLAICTILWAGGKQVNDGALTQGEVVAFVNYMTQTLQSVVYLANLVVVFTRAAASAQRVREVLACSTSVPDSAADPCEVDDESPRALRLSSVCYRYPNAAQDALTNITLDLARGSVLGVIGGTGSGKSTLVSLLPRLADATAGSIEVFGHDIRSYRLADLRHAVSVVPQQTSLLSGTIRSNLTWRDPQASDEELWRALEVAQARDFVSALPQGLDAPVEAGGKNFSGGQRQRLTVARALVGSPRLLVLDDASSALDMKTDAALRTALSGLTETTVVLISQRISSIRGADVICVLSHGEVAGIGTHEQLRANCSVYQEICTSQQVEEDVA